ncbi:unnamed protein product [Coregonus sp. 'balchen']|nr:unnamed protein product [Coregonus sp. 'balchen']
MARFWNKFFLAMIIILIVLFFDAVREVRKYSGAGNSKDANLHPNMFDNLNMKLFRAQRNLYISGFSLFLWLPRQRTLMDGKGDKATAEGNELLRSEMEKLRGELKGSKEESSREWTQKG